MRENVSSWNMEGCFAHISLSLQKTALVEEPGVCQVCLFSIGSDKPEKMRGLSEFPVGLRHWDPVWCFPAEVSFQFNFVSKCPSLRGCFRYLMLSGLSLLRSTSYVYYLFVLKFFWGLYLNLICSPGWPGTEDPFPSVSQVLGLQAYATSVQPWAVL